MKILLLLIILTILNSVTSYGQTSCFTSEEAKKAVESINRVENVAENKEIRKELIKMQQERQKLNLKASQDFEKNKQLV